MMKIKQIVWGIIVLTWIESNAYSSFDQEQTEAIFSRETLNFLQKKLVEINSQSYETYRDRNRVLVLGPTGSGKSTLVTYLASIPLKVGQKSSGQKILIAQSQLPGIEIGDGALAQTKVPAAWLDANDVVYWDCPGFLDTEGPAQEISNAAMIHKIVYNEEKRISDPVKILFVVPYEYVTDEEGTCFHNQLSRVTGMFPDEQLGRSLYLVITQVRPGLAIKDKLLQLLTNLQKPDLHLVERDLSIVRGLKTIVKNDLFYIFPKPSPANVVGSDYISDRDAIDKVLYAEHFPLRVALNLSPEASEYIGRLCASCQEHLISQFRRQGPEVIKSHFTQMMEREEYNEVKGQIQRLKILETAIREISPFAIAEKLEEFVGLPVRLEIEKTLHTLEALRTLEGFQGVDVKSLMRNLLKTVFPEVLKTVSEQLVLNIGKYLVTKGEEKIRELGSKQLLGWYLGLDERIPRVDILLEEFRKFDDTESTQQYATMKQYLQELDSTIDFINPEVITMVKNSHASYVVTSQTRVISDLEIQIRQLITESIKGPYFWKAERGDTQYDNEVTSEILQIVFKDFFPNVSVRIDSVNYLEIYNFIRTSFYNQSSEELLNSGWKYANGVDIPIDFKKACILYLLSNLKEEVNVSHNNIGFMYQFCGVFGKEFQESAFNHYKRGAELNEPYAVYALGFMCENGIGTEKQLEKAEELYLRAHQFGHSGASFYLCGKKTIKEYDKVLEQLIRKGYIMAFAVKNPTETIDRSRWDLSESNRLSFCNLGWVYENGIFGETNMEMAYELYKKAAWQGDLVAQYLYRKKFMEMS